LVFLVSLLLYWYYYHCYYYCYCYYPHSYYYFYYYIIIIIVILLLLLLLLLYIMLYYYYLHSYISSKSHQPNQFLCNPSHTAQELCAAIMARAPTPVRGRVTFWLYLHHIVLHHFKVATSGAKKIIHINTDLVLWLGKRIPKKKLSWILRKISGVWCVPVVILIGVIIIISSVLLLLLSLL
jgi:hypothetical protein